LRQTLTVIGGGLAGCEAAWQAAERGLDVRLCEMRPVRTTEAHHTDDLAELVCSNSLGSKLPDRATGLLQSELTMMDSLLLACAAETAVSAGGALAVGREAFAKEVTRRIEAHPRIDVDRTEITALPDGPTIVASGPLTSPALSAAIAAWSGEEHLFFFDALAPIVAEESVNMDIAYRASRYDRGDTEEGDYINCPLNREEYNAFVDALCGAERIELPAFEQAVEQGVRAGLHRFFEGCLPIEIIAGRGRDALAFGPMRPVGLNDPRTGRRPHAVLQLRRDNLAGTLYNLVGFQTNLRFPEQDRVFHMIPGLEKAEFVRYGQMHRNTFIASPRLLRPTLQSRTRPDLFFAGQVTGVEGYVGNIGTGLAAGTNAARQVRGEPLLEFPRNTMLGSLLHYITHADMADFQPMKANFGIIPPLETTKRLGKRERARAYAERAREELTAFLARE
jgi:methylenetetrahydrofolate--tRNA-(uracil-5-)-methyltransferase